MGVGGHRQAPAALPLGGPQGRSGRVRKSRPPPGFDPRTVQLVASRYTDWDISAHLVESDPMNLYVSLHADPYTLALSTLPIEVDYRRNVLWQTAIRYMFVYRTIPHIFFPHGATAPSGSEPPHYRGFTITLKYTTLGRTPLDEWSARCSNLNLATHNSYKRQKPMLFVGFEPAIASSDRPQRTTP
jgi:hypothetical protein